MIKEMIILTIILEVMTIICRIIFGSRKKRLEKKKYKIRIHHGYVGILLCVIYLFYQNPLLLILGSSLTFSDAIHHFIILPIWVGKTEFP